MTNQDQNTVTRKIGLNKGKRRIWIEGAVLLNNGLARGDRFNTASHTNQLEIILDDAGKRTVSGKGEKPIIDMTGAIITDTFADDIVAVEITKTETGLMLTGVKVI